MDKEMEEILSQMDKAKSQQELREILKKLPPRKDSTTDQESTSGSSASDTESKNHS